MTDFVPLSEILKQVIKSLEQPPEGRVKKNMREARFISVGEDLLSQKLAERGERYAE